MNREDQIFLKRFSQIVVGLAVLTVLLIAAATMLNDRREVEDNPVRQDHIQARIQPLGAVYAGDTGVAAMAAAAEAASVAGSTQVAFDGRVDGELVYNNLCGACHNSGAGGAPMMQRAAWVARMDQGRDTLVKHAIEGYQGEAGVMPARGGNPALSDDQVAASVDWILDNLK